MREIKFRFWNAQGLRFHYDQRQVLSCLTNQICGGYDYTKDDCAFEQFTGLHDKNGLKDIYEGDIISPEGEVIANIHEGKERSGINLAITAMGCKSWRNTEQEAIKRGCFYAK